MIHKYTHFARFLCIVKQPYTAQKSLPISTKSNRQQIVEFAINQHPSAPFWEGRNRRNNGLCLVVIYVDGTI